jgi:four helix bundle protein
MQVKNKQSALLFSSTTRNKHPTTNSTPMSHIDTFEDLDCYKSGRELRKAVSGWARNLPKEEQFRLKDQIIRSSRSVTANIAEGFGRHHPQENLQFCRQSRGSLMETLEHLNAALDDGLIDKVDYEKLRGLWNQSRALLGGYISYLQKLAPKDKRFS